MTERTLFLADTHFRPRTPGDASSPPPRWAEDIRRLSRFLNEVAPGATRLVLLGDTFHCWFERDGRMVGDFAELLDLFRAAEAKGLSIHHISGNRDFAMGAGRGAPGCPPYPGFHAHFRRVALSALVDSGIEPHGERYSFRQDGKSFVCLHGDIHCRRDYIYRILRWPLQGPLGQALMAFGPYAWGAAVVGWFQTRPPRPPKPPKPNKGILSDSIAEELAGGADVVICGHLHREERRALEWNGRRGELFVLPAWTIEDVYGEFAGGELSVRRLPSS